MKLLKSYLNKIYDIFISNWKQFLILGLIYLIIFSLFSPVFLPINDQLTSKLELMDNSKLNSNLMQWVVIGLIGLFFITTWIIAINNFFVFILSKILNQDNFNYSQIIKNNLKYFWKILLFSLIELITITLGIIFFIIPGIYYIFVFHFALPIMANENLSIIDSIKKANKILKANLWKNISLIILAKILLGLALFLSSIIKINGVIILADWFITTALVYLIIYNPIENPTKVNIQNE